MKKIRALIIGYKEWQLDITTSFGEPFINYYDMGRNLGEKLHKEMETK
jgi:hypothetical protein